MKRYIKILSMVLTLSVLGLTSCADDYFVDGENVVVSDDTTAKTVLTFNIKDDTRITRAAQSTYYEYLVQNVYVFVFNNGRRIELSKNFFDATSIRNYKNKDDKNGNTESSGQIVFEGVVGSNLTVCCVANIGTSNSALTRADVGEGDNEVTDEDIQKMDAIQTYQDLQNLAVELDSDDVFRGASFLMTGEVRNVNLAPSTNEADFTRINIDLYRADTKVTFNVTAENSEVTDLKFIPGKWRVVNAPRATWVLPRNVSGSGVLSADMDATGSVESDYFESMTTQFEDVIAGVDNSGTFTFYMYENMKAPMSTITASGDAGYALREKQVKKADGSNGDYIYAPKWATYVVFTGELSYTQDKEVTGTTGTTTTVDYVMADVEYVVHLGHSSATNFNNYTTLRNHHYTYNVTIKGVNDIVVEVDTDNDDDATNNTENRPGAEGDVVLSATQIINVDGHYDRALIALTDEEAKQIYFSVSTPWERGIDANGFMNVGDQLKDYKWVKFLINKDVLTDNTAITTNYARYPGEQCYDGGKTATGTAATSATYNKSVTLRDIRQLSTYLSQEANRTASKASDGKIYITAFIDENIYYYNPTTDKVASGVTAGTNGTYSVNNHAALATTYAGVTTATADGLLLWKQSVNQPDRMMHIVKAGDMKYSADGESSVSRSVVSFKQRAVQTFYNTDPTLVNLKTAWGTETINETTPMTVSRTSYHSKSTYNDYAYSQRLTAYAGSSTRTMNTWANVVSATEQYGLGSSYIDPSYACALRNRDLDGDGNIDPNEVQWYLAPLAMMTDLWVGEPAMPPYAKLFDEKNPDGYYNDRDAGYAKTPATHIVTSTISSNSPWVYWAEEYGATSTHSDAMEWRKAPMLTYSTTTSQISRTNAVVSLRCVRNFGAAYTSTALPQDYVIVSPTPGTNKTSSTQNEYQLDLSYINPLALRTVSDNGGALPYALLNDVGQNNRPYYGFFVDPDYYSLNGSGVDATRLQNTTNTNRRTSWYRAYLGEMMMTDEDGNRYSRVCPDGYRVPNQREMQIMTRLLDGWDSQAGNYSSYLMVNGQELNRQDVDNNFGIFLYYASQARISRTLTTSIENATESGVVRCVKDNLSSGPSSGGEFGDGGDGVQ